MKTKDGLYEVKIENDKVVVYRFGVAGVSLMVDLDADELLKILQRDGVL